MEPICNQRLLWITPGRIFCYRFTETSSTRVLGAHAIYFSLRGALRVSTVSGSSQIIRLHGLSYVPAYTPHRIDCSDQMSGVILVEPETVNPTAIAAGFFSCSQNGNLLLRRLAEALPALQHMAPVSASSDCEKAFDSLIFGSSLLQAAIDERIANALALMRETAGGMNATRLATSVNLSFGRFLHLFKQELGVPFRQVQRWKRTRSWLSHVTSPGKLAVAALEANFSDASHFSRSIQASFGLTPSEIVLSARTMRLLCDTTGAMSANGTA